MHFKQVGNTITFANDGVVGRSGHFADFIQKDRAAVLYNHFRALAGSHSEAARMPRSPKFALQTSQASATKGNGQEVPEDEDFLAAD